MAAAYEPPAGTPMERDVEDVVVALEPQDRLGPSGEPLGRVEAVLEAPADPVPRAKPEAA
jgi:hypothetical protein